MEKDSKIPSDKELRILEAASVLFARYGLRKTSIDEIAQQAGLGKGTIYLYFKSKEELFAKIVKGFGDRLIESLRQVVAEQSDPGQQLERLVKIRMQFLADRMHEAGVSCEVMKEFEDSESSASVAPIILEFREQQIQLVEAIIAAGVQQGLMVCADPRRMATAIMCALEAFSRPWAWQAWEQDSLDNKMETVSKLFLTGLGWTPSPDKPAS